MRVLLQKLLLLLVASAIVLSALLPGVSPSARAETMPGQAGTITIGGLTNPQDYTIGWQILKPDPTTETGWTFTTARAKDLFAITRKVDDQGNVQSYNPTEQEVVRQILDYYEGEINGAASSGADNVSGSFLSFLKRIYQHYVFNPNYLNTALDGAYVLERTVCGSDLMVTYTVPADSDNAGLYVVLAMDGSNSNNQTYNPMAVYMNFGSYDSSTGRPNALANVGVRAKGIENDVDKKLDDAADRSISPGDTASYTVTSTYPFFSDDCIIRRESTLNPIYNRPEMINPRESGIYILMDWSPLLDYEDTVPVVTIVDENDEDWVPVTLVEGQDYIFKRVTYTKAPGIMEYSDIRDGFVIVLLDGNGDEDTTFSYFQNPQGWRADKYSLGGMYPSGYDVYALPMGTLDDLDGSLPDWNPQYAGRTVQVQYTAKVRDLYYTDAADTIFQPRKKDVATAIGDYAAAQIDLQFEREVDDLTAELRTYWLNYIRDYWNVLDPYEGVYSWQTSWGQLYEPLYQQYGPDAVNDPEIWALIETMYDQEWPDDDHQSAISTITNDRLDDITEEVWQDIKDEFPLFFDGEGNLLPDAEINAIDDYNEELENLGVDIWDYYHDVTGAWQNIRENRERYLNKDGCVWNIAGEVIASHYDGYPHWNYRTVVSDTYDALIYKESADAAHTRLTGAHFVCYDNPDRTGDPLKFIQLGDGTYGFVNPGYHAYEDAVADLVVGSTADAARGEGPGSLLVRGLDVDKDYYFFESQAPAGYSLNDTWYYKPQGQLTESSAVSVLSGFTDWSEKMPSRYKFTSYTAERITGDGSPVCTDTVLMQLPSTGAAGTYIFTFLGMALMSAAVLAFRRNGRAETE